ncbi:MAG: hypothetical protein ISS29_02025 [Candidatus Marinimicrobia bacterium]|nr:hypothetical protein [Candidatus Neomarinimicrobiota bacterium]
MQEPWKKDTNDRYVEVVKTVMGLSTAALFLPILLAREFLGVESNVALGGVFTASIYWALFLLAMSILSGVFYQYLSAKWLRIAWGKKAGIFFSKDTKEGTVEYCMVVSLWACIIFFFIGLILQLVFFVF